MPNLDDSPDIKKEVQSDEEDVKISDDEDEKLSPPDHSGRTLEECLKRKREEDEEDNVKADSDISKSPAKRMKSESPPPPPPPPETPIDTPTAQCDDASPADIMDRIHGDTSFADKSMADVLAEAQQDSCDGDGDDGVDASMQDANNSFADIVKHTNCSPHLNDILEHGARSPSQFENGHSPPLTADLSEIKAES